MTEDHAGHGFHFDIKHAVALCLRKVDNLCLGELDVLKVAWTDLGDYCIDFVLSKAIAIPIIAIEFVGQFAHRNIAALFDVFERGCDHGCCFGVVFSAIGFGFSVFEVGYCNCVILAYSGVGAVQSPRS